MITETVKNCPNCNEPVPPEAPGGLCPKCLLAAASIPTETGQPPETGAPPSLESIAAGFPNLEILEFIGQGGMGLVFKARQTKLDRLVALKLLPQKPGADPAFCERFNREARVLARLSHPNIVAVHDFGETGPFFYLLMEFVDGVNLRQAMRANRFTPAQALALVPQICDALQYAHEQGVLHRDIKPENLLLDTRGRVKIADFGIAKLLGEPKDVTLTARGAAIGTPHYMAPEQLERPQDVDQRADVFSLGVVFYEMLTGELPLGRFAPPSEKASIDPRVDQVVLRTLEKERERRFQSAGDVKTQVERISATPLGGEADPGVRPAGGASPSRKWLSSGRLRSTADLIALGLVSLSLLVFGLVILNGPHMGPEALPVLCPLIALPALAGTLLGWIGLRDLRATPNKKRGGKMAFFAAIAWPLLLMDLFCLFVLFMSNRIMQAMLTRSHDHGVNVLAFVVGLGAVAALDIYLVRRWSKHWTNERVLPGSDIPAFLKRTPRSVLWFAAAALVLLFVLTLAVPRASFSSADPIPSVQQPMAPPGFEVAPGGPPGDGRLYNSTIIIPAGYALSLSTVLCSNQVPIKSDLSKEKAVIAAPDGAPVQGQITWRLLGNATLADGAPLQISFVVPPGPENASKSLHVFPPEAITVDWVSEPPQLWPPQNGHTRFLLVRGNSTAELAGTETSTEWAVGLEARLDPLAPDVLQNLKSPTISIKSPAETEDPDFASKQSVQAKEPGN